MCDLLNGFIGIRGCDDDVPPSGLYVNDVPGVSSHMAAKVVDAEDVSGQTLLERCVTSAYLGGLSDVLIEVAKEGFVFMPQRMSYGQNSMPIENRYLEAGETAKIYIYPATPYEELQIDRIQVWGEGPGTLTWSITGDDMDTESGTFSIEDGAETTEAIGKKYRRQVVLQITADTRLKYYTGENCACTKGASYPGRIWVTSIYDQCLLAFNYRFALAPVFIGKAAINFLQEGSLTTRTSSTARSAPAVTSMGLRYLLGGQDPDTGVFHPGSYPGTIKAVARGFIKEIRNGAIPGFECDGIGYHEVTP